MAPSLSAQTHEDPRHGFKVRYPKGLERDPPASPTQLWEVAAFQSDKAYHFTDSVSGYSRDLKPEMRVIAFYHLDDDELEKVLVDEKDDDKGVRVTLLRNPFADYMEYPSVRPSTGAASSRTRTPWKRPWMVST